MVGNENDFLKISFCTTCMGRLHHLKQTLPKNLEDNADYPHLEFCILDYSSPDGLEEWIHEAMGEHLESGRVVYQKSEGHRRFHFSKAKNLSHRMATGDVVCNLDADNFTGPGFAHYINCVMRAVPNAIGVRGSGSYGRGSEGRIFLARHFYEELGGYDEAFEGWSLEDTDLIRRAVIQGLRQIRIPRKFRPVVNHSMEERAANVDLSIKDACRENGRRFQANAAAEIELTWLDRECRLENLSALDARSILFLRPE